MNTTISYLTFKTSLAFFKLMKMESRWPNTVFARAFAVLCFAIIERSVVMALLFYYKDMLENVTIQGSQQFSAFLCYRKNPVKCSACAVARNIETDCICRNLPISYVSVVRISRNLAKKKNSSETTLMIYHEKSEF